MQEDFHFCVVYMLSRCAGLHPVESRTVACASQFTDECTFLGPATKPGGGTYTPELTYPPGAVALNKKYQKEVLGPFHFAGAGNAREVVKPGNV